MSKAVLVIDMPSCCDECFVLDDNGDYPMCIIIQKQRGYTFRTREQKMDRAHCNKCQKRVILANQIIINGVIGKTGGTHVLMDYYQIEPEF